MSKYVCVSSHERTNIILEADQIKDSTVKSLREDILKTTETLWLRTRYFSMVLMDTDIPLQFCPAIALTYKHGGFRPPEFCLYLSLFPETDQVFLTFDVTSNLTEKVPGYSVQFSKSELFSGTVGDVYTRVESGWPHATVKSVTVNGKPVDKKTKLSSFIDFRNFPSLGIEIDVAEKGKKLVVERANVIAEIAKTEESFVADLVCLMKFWAVQFSERGLLDNEGCDKVFKGIPVIYNYHEMFLQAFMKANQGYASIVGSVFLDRMATFKDATVVVSKYQNVVDFIAQKKKQGKAFANALFEMSKKQGDRDFLSFLVAIVQRFPRYDLFLKKLIDITPRGHPDAELLPIAQKRIEMLTQDMDVMTRKEKEQLTMQRLQEKIRKYGGVQADFKLADPSRTILCQLKVLVTRIPGKRTQNGVLFLFGDMVLLVKETEKTAKIYYQESVNCFHYYTVPRDYRSMILVMCVQDRDKCDRSEFLVTFGKSEEQATFFTNIANIQGKIVENGNADMVWKLDSLCDSVESVCQHSALGCGNAVVFFSGVKTDQRNFSPDFLTYCHEDNLIRNAPISQMTCYEAPIPPRRKHTMTYMNGSLYIVGGIMRQNDVPFITKFEIAKKAAINCCKAAVMKRYGHTCLAHNGKLIVFGGKTKQPLAYLNDITVIDLEKASVTQLQVGEPKPEGRYDHSAVIFENKMYIFGGKGQKGVLGDIWSFDLQPLAWRELRIAQGLIPRRAHLVVMLGQEMVIIGGFQATYRRLPVQAVDLQEKKSRVISSVGNVPPCLKYMSGAITDSKEIVIYGGLGYKSHVPLSAIYVLELAQEWIDRAKAYEAEHPNTTESMNREEWNALLNTSCCHTILAHRSMWFPQTECKKRLRPDISVTDLVVDPRDGRDPKGHTPLRATVDPRRAKTGSLGNKAQFTADRRSLNLRRGGPDFRAVDPPEADTSKSKNSEMRETVRFVETGDDPQPIPRARRRERSNTSSSRAATKMKADVPGSRRSIDMGHGGIPLPVAAVRPVNSHQGLQTVPRSSTSSSSQLLRKEPRKQAKDEEKRVERVRSRPASMSIPEKKVKKQMGIQAAKEKPGMTGKPPKDAKPGTPQVKLSQAKGSAGSRSAAPPRSRPTTCGTARRSSGGRSSFRLF